MPFRPISGKERSSIFLFGVCRQNRLRFSTANEGPFFPVLFLKEKGRIFPDSEEVGGNIGKERWKLFLPTHSWVGKNSFNEVSPIEDRAPLFDLSFPEIGGIFLTESEIPEKNPSGHRSSIGASRFLSDQRWLCRKWHAIFGKAISARLSSHGPPRESHEWIRGGVPSESFFSLCPAGAEEKNTWKGEKRSVKKSLWATISNRCPAFFYPIRDGFAENGMPFSAKPSQLDFPLRRHAPANPFMNGFAGACLRRGKEKRDR